MNKTEILFILDRSGSMAGLESDTIGGFNTMLAKQRALEGEARVSTILFDNFFEVLHDRLDLKDMTDLTGEQYFVRGSTALYDAIGLGVGKIAAVEASLNPETRPDKVVVVIITDGYENSSREYNLRRVRQLIDQQTKAGWEFLFLGANIDAFEAASNLGMPKHRATNVINDKQGVFLQYDAVSYAISNLRAGQPLPKDWKAKVEEDHLKRSKGS